MTRLACLALGLFPALFAALLLACSSSSGGAAAQHPDASTKDASEELAPEAAPFEAAAFDASEAAVDAGADAPAVPCTVMLGCPLGQSCCVGPGGGTCGQSCGCLATITCANTGGCTTPDVCCLQPSSGACAATTYESLCLATCTSTGGSQLCNPTGGGAECQVGTTCSSSETSVGSFGLPADAGYGVCQ